MEFETEKNHDAGRMSPEGLLRLFFCTVMLLLFAAAVLSYAPADAAVLYGGVSREAENWIGWVGAWVSHMLFMHIGLGIYLLLLLAVVRGVRSVLEEFDPSDPGFKRWQGLAAAVILIFGTVLLLGLVPEMFAEILPPLGLGHADSIKSGLSGGVIGQFFASPRHGVLEEGLLRHLIGSVGCAIIGMAFVFGGLVWLYLAEWKDLVKKCFSSGTPVVPEQPRMYDRGTGRNIDLPFRQTAVNNRPLESGSRSFSPPAPEVSAPVEAVSAAASVVHNEVADTETEDLEIAEVEKSEDIAGEFPESTPAEQAAVSNAAPLPGPAASPAEAPQVHAANNVPDIELAPSKRQAPELRGNELDTRVIQQGTNQAAPQNEYVLPPLSMLSQGDDGCGEDLEEISAAKNALEQTLEDFGIRGWVSNHTTGPRVTRFEVTLEPGVNVRKVEQIADNIAMNLAAQSVRILAPIPGRPVVGVEISNSKASAVFMRSVMESEQWRSGKAEIPIALGKDVSGKPVVLDIASAPHMLIAGSTGTGKSVCSNSLIMSLLFRFRPDELKLIMVDPKVVEFDVYKNLPHLLTPVINDSTKVPVALRWAVNEMEKRYRILAAARVKKISEFNRRPPSPEPLFDEDGVMIPDRMPVLLVIIDELGDLMMTEAKKDVENSITRIAQKGRAAGVHVVVATQRPSTNVITGVIKANLPTRLCFQVRSLIDSRVVLDSPGGEKLLGKGDMLYMSPSSMHIERVQGSFVPDSDIQKVVEFVSAQAPQQFNSAVIAEEEETDDSGEDFDDDDDGAPWDEGGADVSALVRKYMRPGDSDMMRQALEVVILDRKASTSYLQRRLGIGYNKAAEIIDQMEARGIVGPPSGSGNKRNILVFDGLDIND
ncbi:MAG: DNA translocase FtsK 4TM domain-containing protein [Lentisphaeria bacterium]|nr:DNA translocase FtsK 4TM domain-containing protein [Lentisphaeria bacterium]